MKGKTFGKEKPKPSTVSPWLVRAIGLVSQLGDRKYKPFDWRRRYTVREAIDKSLRHLFEALEGVSRDSESGLHPLFHAATDLMYAIEIMARFPKKNDLTPKALNLIKTRKSASCPLRKKRK